MGNAAAERNARRFMAGDVWIFGTVRESITTSPDESRCAPLHGPLRGNDDTTIRRRFGAGTKATKSTKLTKKILESLRRTITR